MTDELDKESQEEEDLDDPFDEGIIKGYEAEEELPECAECGEVIRGKPVQKTMEGEKFNFCSKDCHTDFEESQA